MENSSSQISETSDVIVKKLIGTLTILSLFILSVAYFK